MKFFSALLFLFKMFLSLAGIAFLIKRLGSPQRGEHYNFTIDAAISGEPSTICNRSGNRRKFNIGDLQRVYFQSLDT